MGQARHPATHRDRQDSPQGLVRFAVESALLLAIAVTTFRAFCAEGYMISTGSMAPSLLGYHRHVCCPACRYAFDRGAAVVGEELPGSAGASALAEGLESWAPATSRCPNCGTAVSEAGIPRTEGDQLMVHKHHFELRDPVRWEVVVFRNPQLPTQAYVKRVAGLPGETIAVIDGDLYADGVLQRKPLDVQRALRIPVDDFAHQPPADDPDWQPRWQTASAVSRWSVRGGTLHFRGETATGTQPSSSSEPLSPAGEVDWVQYRHWIRAGGHHRCRVPLAQWPNRHAEPGLLRDGFRYDAAAHELEAVGAVRWEALACWLDRVESTEAREALHALYLKSHQPPLVDVCSYNHPDVAPREFPIHDLLLELELTVRRPGGLFVLAMHDGCHELVCTFDLERSEVRLTADGKPAVHRTVKLPDRMKAGEPVLLTMSQFDRQVLVAADGVELFPPLPYAGEGERPPLPASPVRLGAHGCELEVRGLRLDRDVYYTSDPAAAPREYPLGPDEFFVLGDNSPVSLDSRAWPEPAMKRELLIGKPFVVHLPSRSQPLTWGNQQTVLRIPDFSRVRYIR